MPTPSPSVYLIDASPYIFRAFFSLPSKLTDAQGRQANAVYGFSRFLLKLIADYKPSHVAVCFDGSLTTSFRNELFPDYKKQREAPAESLVAQLEECRSAAEAIGLACFIDASFEADDLIASLRHELTAAKRSFTVVTSDKDLAQLVDEATDWLDAAKGERYDADGVRSRLGVDPLQIPDLLGLAGDSVDNIPGVRGIGPKTAMTLLDRYGDLDTLFSRLEDLPDSGIRGAKSLALRLHENEEIARLSRQLAVLQSNALEPTKLETLSVSNLTPSAFKSFCDRMGFENLHQFLETRAG